MKKILFAVLIGVLLGVVAAKYLFVGSGLSLVVWAIVGLALGVFTATIKQSAVVGSLYGFVLAFSFMFAGYQGTDSLVSRTIPFAILGLIGAVCGATWSLIGYIAAKKLRRRQSVDL